MTRCVRSLGVLALVALATGACAARQAPSLLDQLVREGTPLWDAGGTVATPRPERTAGSAPATPVPSRRAVARLAGTTVIAEHADPALVAALRAVRAAPSDATHYVAAEAYRRAGIPDLAYEHLQRVLAINPHHAGAHDALARLWRDWGQLPRALEEARRAVRDAPESGPARNTLGTVFWALGRHGEAAAAFHAARVRDPQAVYAVRNLCAALARAGRSGGASVGCAPPSLTRR